LTSPTLASLLKLPVSSLLDVSRSVLRDLLASTYDVVSEEIVVAGQPISFARVRSSSVLIDAITSESFAVDERLPYWSELWPSSVILAEHVAQTGICRRARVLDLGCGLGLTGIVAASNGGMVHMTDYEYDALVFTAHNIATNVPTDRRKDISLECFDWRSSAIPSGIFDIVMGSDILYERRNFVPLLQVLDASLKRDGLALFSDPDRSAGAEFLALAKRNGFRISSKTHTRDSTPPRIMIHSLQRSASDTGD